MKEDIPHIKAALLPPPEITIASGGIGKHSEKRTPFVKSPSMNLLSFIELEIKRDSASRSSSSKDKDAVCLQALKAFLGDKECDLRHAVFSDFLYGFGTFLAREYEKKYSPATNCEILRTLRKWIRAAISRGYLPNIDAVPAVIERLSHEFWPDKSTGTAKSGSSRLQLGTKEAVNTLMRNVDAWILRQQMGSDPKPSDKGQKAVALQNRCAALYLFGLLTYGLEIRDTLAIKCDWNGPEIPDRATIVKFGVVHELSPAARNLVKLFNQDFAGHEHLFCALDQRRYKENPAAAAKSIEENIDKFFRRTNLPLYKSHSVFVDWLNYAVESGLGMQEAEVLWRNHLDGKTVTSALPQALDAQARVDGAPSGFDESWYLLSLVPLSVKRDRLRKMLLSSGILGAESDAIRRIYVPEERLRSKERGEYAVFSRYIFFRGTPVQAEFANSFTPYAFVLRDRASNSFARIRESEIRNLQVMLRDFPDAVELVDGRKWLEEHNARIVEGCRAVIRSGSLAGREATVVSVKGRDRDKLTFLLEFVEGAIKFQTSLEGVQLDIVQQ